MVSKGNHGAFIAHIGYPNNARDPSTKKLTFNLPKVSVNGNWLNMICEVFVFMGMVQQCVIPGNALPLYREDSLSSSPPASCFPTLWNFQSL